jgi:molybdopterin synthase catalytic subunit
MAEKLMDSIEAEIRSKWIVDEVALVHRIGLLRVGEIAVVTAVSAPHRKEAFEACRYAIDRVKSIVPIWKREEFEDGLAWVVGQHDVDITAR